MSKLVLPVPIPQGSSVAADSDQGCSEYGLEVCCGQNRGLVGRFWSGRCFYIELCGAWSQGHTLGYTINKNTTIKTRRLPGILEEIQIHKNTSSHLRPVQRHPLGRTGLIVAGLLFYWPMGQTVAVLQGFFLGGSDFTDTQNSACSDASVTGLPTFWPVTDKPPETQIYGVQNVLFDAKMEILHP